MTDHIRQALAAATLNEGARTMTILDPGSHDDPTGDTAKPEPRTGTLTLPSRPSATPAPPRHGTIPPRPGTLTAARLKVTLTLNAAELLAITASKGKPRITLRIRLPDRTITAEIAAKSLRKAQTAIREAGADNIALVLQGHLVAGDRVAEAGLSAQPRSPKAP
jgi:hypothetical protein